MQVEGEYTFNAPPEAVFDLLQDPEALAKAMPGATSVSRVGENVYEAQVAVKVGAVSGSYTGTVSIEEARRPEYFRLTVEGKGAGGFLKGEGTVELSPVPAGTQIRYAGTTEVGGRIAQVGQRLLQPVARKLIQQGLQQLEVQLAERQAAETEAGGEAPRDEASGRVVPGSSDR